MPTTTTESRNFRFTPKTDQRLNALADRWEMTKTAVLTQLIKKAAEEEGIEVSQRARDARDGGRRGGR